MARSLAVAPTRDDNSGSAPSQVETPNELSLGQSQSNKGSDAERDTQHDDINHGAEGKFEERGQPVLSIDPPDRDEQLNQNGKAKKSADDRG